MVFFARRQGDIKKRDEIKIKDEFNSQKSLIIFYGITDYFKNRVV